MSRACFVAGLALSLAGCDDTPTRPDGNPDPQGRTGLVLLTINCGETGASPLVCRATGMCSGLYRYCPALISSDDVTTRVPWYSENENIADATASGVFVAGSPGDTVVGVGHSQISYAGAQATVSVYADGAIFRTLNLSGYVYQAGPAQSAIPGALVEILDGRVAGRTALSGAPGCLAAYAGLVRYCFYAIPPGTYRLRASASGFVSQEKEVVLSSVDTPIAVLAGQVNFAMQPQ